MTTRTQARCAIYADRPELCRAIPTGHGWMPEACTFWHDDHGKIHGSCDCRVGACCAEPRKEGDPLGQALPEDQGGEPCRHLVWREIEIPEPAVEVGDSTKHAVKGLGDDNGN